MMEIAQWLQKQIGTTCEVIVTPKAASNRIKLVKSTNAQYTLRVYVTVAPEKGKANKAMIELLAKTLKLASSQIHIIKGHTSRHKVIQISKQ